MASSYLFNTEQTLDSIEAQKKANNTPQTWSPTDWWDGFKEENLFTNMWEYFANNEDYPAKDGYLYSEDPQLEGMEDFHDQFFFSRSPEESAAIKAKLIERAEQNYASPWYYLGRVTGAFADPSTLLLWTKAGQSAKVFGSAMIAEEFAKQNMDTTRDDSYAAWVAGIGIGVPVALSLFKTRPSVKVQQEMKVLDKKWNEGVGKEVLVDGKWIDPHTKVGNSSVGAAATKQSAKDDITIGAREASELEGQKFVESKLKWFGEDGPWTPVFRLTKTNSNIARNMVADLLDTPLLKMRNTEKWGYEATGKSLETDLRMYQVHEIESLKFIKDQYLKYLKANKQSVPKSEIGIMLKNTMNNDGVFSLSGFSKEVTKAMVMGEHAVPEVAQAARFSKKNFYDRLFKEANELKIREQPILHELNFWKYHLKEMQRMKSGKKVFNRPSENTQYTYSRTEIENIIDTLTDALNNIRKNPDGVKDYINIVYNKDAILANKARFRQIIVENFERRLRNNYIKRMPSAKVIDDIVEDLSNHFPFKAPNKTAWKEVQNGMDLLIQRYAFNRPRYARALRRRTLNLDKEAQLELIKGNFMVSDIFALQKIYYRSITPDILLTRKYGDTAGLGLNYVDEASSATFPGIKQVFQEYQLKTFRAKNKKEKIALQKEKFQALNDLEASVDLIRGTYGVPANPHAWYSRAMRMFKHYNALTMLTGFMAAIPDTARVVMTSGIKRGFQTQFEMFSKGFKQNSIFAMGKREAQSFGEALDMITGQRAMLFSDIGDMFGMGNKLESGLGKVSQMNFMYVNLMSRWTEFAKSTASVTIGSRILEDSLKWAKGQPLGTKWKTALAASGIDKGMAIRIANQLEKHGAIPGGKGDIGLKYNYIANSSMWDDALAKNAFGAAMNKEINRTIVTPSKGDTPLWMSNQFGSTWAQFKKFAMGAQQRMLMRGMQERDLDFLFGSMLLIGSGMMIDAIYHKYRFQRDYGKLSMTQKLLNAFDRSGLGGIYMDINKAIETLTDNRIGIAPFLGSRRPYSPSGRWIAGTVGGPTAGQIYNIFDILYDVGGNKYNHHTAKNVRRLIPFQNVWYLDWLFDGAEKGLRFK